MKKNISIKEFTEKGYLQELNRRFLHPLGLTMKVNLDGDGYISNIEDYRDDLDGVYYDVKEFDIEDKEKFKENYYFIESEINKRNNNRSNFFNSHSNIEDIPE